MLHEKGPQCMSTLLCIFLVRSWAGIYNRHLSREDCVPKPQLCSTAGQALNKMRKTGQAYWDWADPSAKANSEQKWMQLCPWGSEASSEGCSDSIDCLEEQAQTIIGTSAKLPACERVTRSTWIRDLPPGQFAASLPRMR